MLFLSYPLYKNSKHELTYKTQKPGSLNCLAFVFYSKYLIIAYYSNKASLNNTSGFGFY